MKPLDLIGTAHALLKVSKGKPKQADLRRAHSTAYYALFHCIARDAADLLVGGAGAEKIRGAWQQAYRALEHRSAKQACLNRQTISRFPKAVEDLANAFATMQKKRHDADYDPYARVTKSEVESDIELITTAIVNYRKVPAKARRAFRVLLLLKDRKA